MKEKLLMGNEAIGLGALRAGVGFVAGYPGTPSTEILETVAKYRDAGTYVEWSVNEKAAMEAAAGAAYAGVRTMVTMKQVGLNVASDPLMSLSYIGIKGGMVVVVADDPGPISSQTEQDTRHFAEFAKLPVFDPSSPEEAYQMIGDAFALSEELQTPVLFRPTTRVCHGCVSLPLEEPEKRPAPEGFVKDTSRWVIFPKLTYQNHQKIEARNASLRKTFSEYRFNRLAGSGQKGIATGGVSYAYTKEALQLLGQEPKLLKVGTPHPFPEQLALRFLDGLDEVLVLEELDPVIERELVYLCGKYRLNVIIKGKLTGDMPNAGELSVEIAKMQLSRFLDLPISDESPKEAAPALPVRPPVLCAGCPHRASFYAVKQAKKGRKAVFSGDIGCYTLGNAAPLDMVDTCLCMGAGVTIAQGLHRVEPDAVNFAFIGDSTFFASGLTGVVNAVYNDADIVLIVLDNSTTAMTGHQPHPGTGKTMMGEITRKVSIPKILEGIGVSFVRRVNPLDLQAAKEAVQQAAAVKGVSAVIFESPCVALIKPAEVHTVENTACVGCKKCIRELGCPALVLENGKAKIEPDMCYGCGLCAQVCPVSAIRKRGDRE
ncbi:MAG: indolepyruvate ferredoxin oxidoreductase subunit alpha [Oscillospiraceae bacterium]|nr:indolepyruvate ferredoxin oxidoreductase subunit alpha [Oscillospiraceae bacterium]